MAYKITDDCTNCGSCVADCGVEAIIIKDDNHWIDPDKCIDCSACVNTCPTEAIVSG